MEMVEKKLFELQDLGYRDFHSRLMPDYDKERVIGVRTPDLRNFVKEFSKDSEAVHAFFSELPHRYYEENNLHAFLIEKVRNYDEAIGLVEEFLPYIDNWATCDCFKPLAFKKNYEDLYDKTLKWMKSDHTYTVRFGIVTQLKYFLEEDTFNPEIIDIMAGIKSDEYYINMAIAWYYSFALIKQYDKTIGLFEEKRLDKWVHNKSIQKAIESYRIDKETKDYLRSLKVK